MATKAIALAATPAITGAGKAKRQSAFIAIAPHAYGLEQTRTALVARIGEALGKTPDAALLDHVRREIVVGTVAAKLPAGELPRGCTDDSDRMTQARDYIVNYAAPPQEGAKPRKLRAGQKGRRTAIQHRIIRNAEEFASKLLAELGQAGKTNAETNKAKRNPAPNGKAGEQNAKTAKKGATDTAKPTGADLVKAPIKTRGDALTHIVDQSAALLAFANKYAKLVPADMGTAVNAFRTACLKAMNAEQERVARADAKAAAKETETA